MKKINIKIIKEKIPQCVLFFVLAGAMVVSTQPAGAWTGPTANPPQGNADTPINVGATEQTKQGTFGSSKFCLLGDCITTWPAGGGGGGESLWSQSGSKIYYNTGNVGIGASNPGEKLEVAGNIEANKMEDRDQFGYYVDPGGNSMFQNIYASKFYDKDDTDYYINPASTSKFKTINLGGVPRDTWPEGGGGGDNYVRGGLYGVAIVIWTNRLESRITYCNGQSGRDPVYPISCPSRTSLPECAYGFGRVLTGKSGGQGGGQYESMYACEKL